MNENKNIKISLSTFFLILAIIIIIIMGYLIYKIDNEKNMAEKQVNELNDKVINLEETINNVYNTISGITTNDKSNTNSNKNLSEKEEKELFNKITDNKEILQEMVCNKDFSVAEFKDEEILKLLPVLDDSRYFTRVDTSEGDFAKASISDVQKIAKRYFGKEINDNVIKENLKNNEVTIEVASGYGIINYELLSVEAKGDNKYAIRFKYIAENENSTYILTITLNSDEIIYNTLEK